jgi:photosystem II stability/assembly factor-like uncharacterized protein
MKQSAPILGLLCLLIGLSFIGQAQTVRMLTTGTKTSLRGLSVVSDRTIWVSGSNGMVGQSLDSGINWRWMQVAGFEKTEFRDIEAFDDLTAVIMAIDSPACILKTIDGGKTWTKTFQDNTRGMFLDAMEFWNINSGIVIGDPIEGKFFIARTFDGGDHWQAIPMALRPLADSGEACFASSGTNIRKLNKAEAIFISGGLRSSVFVRDLKSTLPLLQGENSTGANSIAIKNQKNWMVVGGDFMKKDSMRLNCIYTEDGGKTWQQPLEPPHGYRSCVEFIKGKTWISCGLNGVDITKDGGRTFQLISPSAFHVCRKSKKGKAVFLAGGKGSIGKME